MDWSTRGLELMWIGGLAAVPVALLAGALTRWRGTRPATRHAMWIAVMVTFIAPMLSAGLWRPAWFKSERVLAVVHSLTTATEPKAAPVTTAAASAPAMRESAIADPPPAQDPRPREVANTSAPTATPVTHPRPRGRPQTSSILTDAAPVEHASASEAKPESLAIPLEILLLPYRLTQLASWPLDQPMVALSPPAAKTAAPAVAPVAVPPSGPTEASQVRAWLGHVLTVRDAIASVPPIPPIVWLLGAAFMALICIIRTALMARLLRRGEPAPAPLTAMVRRLSRLAGLRRAPMTLVVPDRVSPMIWCGIRPRLVLPVALWRELDADSQRAVVMHELSHLRRKDHRLCWLEALIGLVYWWHPVAWWVRRRLRDEAEACCDAWVTTLMPNGRRAYAEALVATKSFLSVPGASGAPGLGVMNGRTRQLARRLTMVMTQRVAPRASWTGMVLAAGIAAAGMLVMPGLACPPTDEEAKAAQAAEVKAKMEAKVAKAQAKHAAAAAKEQDMAAKRKGESAAKSSGGVEFFGEAPALEAMRARNNAEQAGAHRDVDQLNNALRDKERSLQQMQRQLQDTQRQIEQMLRQEGQRTAPRASARPGASTITLPAQPRITTPPGAVAIGRSPSPGVSVLTAPTPPMLTYDLRPTPQPGQATIATTVESDDARSYSLPSGKLESLTELMARQDVPIIIERHEDHIVVHATPEQHRIFAAFVHLINPDSPAPAGVLMGQSGGIGWQTNSLYGALAANPATRGRLQAQTDELRAAARQLAKAKADSARQSDQLRGKIEQLREETERAKDQMQTREEPGADTDEDRPADPTVERHLEHLDQLLEHVDGVEERLDSLDSMADDLEAQLDALMDSFQDVSPEPSAAPEGLLPTPSDPIIAPETPMPPEAAAAPAAPSTPAAPAAPAAASAPIAPAAPVATAKPASRP